jgi:hypothetical protein
MQFHQETKLLDTPLTLINFVAGVDFQEDNRFMKPWFLRFDALAQNNTHIAQIINNLLALNHPFSSSQTIFTFLWCLEI